MARVGGTPDTRTGYDSGQHYSPEEVAEYWRRRNAGKVRHPSELAVERQEAERQREAERKAATPDPRAALRTAHLRRAEAKGELDRLVQLRGRAADLVAHLEQRHTELLDLARQGTRQAANDLVGALGQSSMDDLPLSPQNEALQDQLLSVTGRLGVAKTAVQELSEQHRDALDAVREADSAVSVAAVQVAVDYSVREGEEIEQLTAELHRRRSDLNSLSSAITSEIRRLPFRSGLYLPAQVGRVLAGLDSRVDPAMSARLKRLHEDPEASLE